MELKKGRVYYARNGDTVEVFGYLKVEGSNYPFHCRFLDGSHNSDTYWWAIDGHFEDGITSHKWDLLGEVKRSQKYLFEIDKHYFVENGGVAYIDGRQDIAGLLHYNGKILGMQGRAQWNETGVCFKTPGTDGKWDHFNLKNEVKLLDSPDDFVISPIVSDFEVGKRYQTKAGDEAEISSKAGGIFTGTIAVTSLNNPPRCPLWGEDGVYFGYIGSKTMQFKSNLDSTLDLVKGAIGFRIEVGKLYITKSNKRALITDKLVGDDALYCGFVIGEKEVYNWQADGKCLNFDELCLTGEVDEI